MTPFRSKDPIHGFAIVTMIDALGVRGFSVEKCVDFFKLRQELIDKSLFRWKVASKHDIDGNNSKINFYTQSFADTLVFAIEMTEFESKHGKTSFPTGNNEADNLFYGMWLEKIAYVLGDLIRDSLYNKVIFRGAMAAGEYIIHEESNSILGPAVVDVARHYEAFESIGIILTPTSSVLIDNLTKHRNPWSSLTKTTINFKNNREDDIYVVNWPNAFCKENYSKEVIEIAKKDFYEILASIEIPEQAEAKYNSAKKFFEKILENGQQKT